MGLSSYSSAGDIITVVICIICWLFLNSTYSTKEKNLILFQIANGSLFIAAISSITYNTITFYLQPEYVNLVVSLHNIIYCSLGLIFVLYCIYLSNLFEMSKKAKHILYALIIPEYLALIIYKLITPLFGIGFYIDENMIIHYDHYMNVFIVYYIYFATLIVVFINIYKKRMLTKIRKCLQCVIGLSFTVIFIEYIFHATTFTCISFSFPILTVLFFFHYNAYDTKTGTLDFKSFRNYIKDLKNKPFGIFCVYLKNFSIENNQELSSKFVQYTEVFFQEYCMFRISDEKIMLVYKKRNNSTDKNIVQNVFLKFNELYTQYKIPFKIVYIQSDNKLRGNDYIDLSNMLINKMDLNTFYKCKDEDIDAFLDTKSIKNILFDIYTSNDIDDHRVKVYCQPILDVKTNAYKNAEVLMRIESDDIMYMPEYFIPIAESNGYIHTLSKIILNKVCKCINELVKEGYQFDRISINLSTLDFKERDFYKEILDIIEKNNTSTEKIAIEITESEDESEYKAINRGIKKLKDKGIIFYLDDFGTGYSNFQRTFTLPVDVIKFDRALTALACKNAETYSMVKKFSYMLSTFGYKILFEGVETPEDEIRCKEMTVSYLQGYKYSEPIEIEKLKDYFVQTN